ncbi:hypothetical protein J3362_13345 [Marinobacter sp. NFXS11]|uniref:hypothetical protein n=1 Tax=Marinobacter sp. NFXS11 TaxID=2818432 RepID=UPI0032DEDC1D
MIEIVSANFEMSLNLQLILEKSPRVCAIEAFDLPCFEPGASMAYGITLRPSNQEEVVNRFQPGDTLPHHEH